MVAENEFDFLIGLELSGVSFVRDYVEFLFDGPVLRVMSEPEARVAGRRGTFPDPPFRDVACELIGGAIVAADADPHGLTIVFETGGSIRVPFSSEDAGPEVVHFVPWLNGAPHVESMRTWENLAS
ncbi:MAG TPA: hypothetical protein DCR14_00220 [Acidimicrobiaceae bacterium]|nr:hypothetical protein [Acidimicrobiaceae bacterium]